MKMKISYLNHRQSRSKGKKKTIKLHLNSLSFFFYFFSFLVWITWSHIDFVHNSRTTIEIFNDDALLLQSISRNKAGEQHSSENKYNYVKPNRNNIHLIHPPIRNSSIVNKRNLHFYFINLDESTDRAMALTQSIANLSLKPQSSLQVHRVSAVTVDEVKEMYRNGLLYFKQAEGDTKHNRTKLIDRARTPSDYNTFTFHEVACTLSHLRAIKQAYDDGQEAAFIIEDDALISQDFIDNWESYADQAPSDWQILQWITNNIYANKRALHTYNDFWMSWRCYFWGTAFYTIRRDGMERIIDASYKKSVIGHANRTSASHAEGWIFSEPQVVTADSLVYYLTKTYTSTYPWITLQNCSSTIMHGFREDYTFGKSSIKSPPPKLTNSHLAAIKRPETIAVVMNLRLTDITSSADEIQSLLVDVETFSSIHPHSRWFVKIVLVSDSLKSFVETMLSSYFPSPGIGSFVHIHLEVNSKRFNKFIFLRAVLDEVKSYEYVLLKDNDISLAGFEWNTFMDAKGNSTLSSPFYETSEDWLERNRIKRYDSNQLVNLQHGTVFNRYYDELYSTPLEPIPTMFLEMKLVLMKGQFAYWFFSRIFQARFFVDQNVSWGVDLMWCGAAYQYNTNHDNKDMNICSLIPLNILDRDTKQISKNNSFRVSGNQLVKRWEKDPRFSSWFSKSYLALSPKHYTLRDASRLCQPFYTRLHTPKKTMSQCGKAIHAVVVKNYKNAGIAMFRVFQYCVLLIFILIQIKYRWCCHKSLHF